MLFQTPHCSFFCSCSQERIMFSSERAAALVPESSWWRFLMVGKPLMAGSPVHMWGRPLRAACSGHGDFIAAVVVPITAEMRRSRLPGNPLASVLPLCLGMRMAGEGSQLSTVCAPVHVRPRMYCATNFEHCAAVPLLALCVQPYFVTCTQPVWLSELQTSKLKLQHLGNRMMLDAYFCELCLDMHQLCP